MSGPTGGQETGNGHSADNETEARKREIARVFGIDPADLEPTAEEVEDRRRFEAYRDALPGRANAVADQITAQAHRDGWLPEGWRFTYKPVSYSTYAAMARTQAAIIERCTCLPGPRTLAEVHESECSLQNTGYLS